MSRYGLLAAIEGYMMTESKTAEILNDGLGATIHGKTTKETLEIINFNEADAEPSD